MILDKNGVVVTLEEDKSLVFTGFRHGNIYLVDFSPGRNQIYPTFESLVANASFIRRKASVSLRVDVMKDSFLVMHQTPKHIEYLHRLLKKTPYELITGKKPNISYFRVFGCKCFIYKKKRLGKFESRYDEGFFLGYASNSKA